MSSVYGEVTADGTTIVVAVGGDSADALKAAKRLKTLTPLFTRSNPPGALTVPLTWAATIQLAECFGASWTPGPRLRVWIADEIRRRTIPQQPRIDWPVGLTPYPWQLEGARLIGSTGRALITDEPGTGKTATAILGLLAWKRDFIGPVIVVCPAAVVDPWVDAWQTWAPHVRVVDWRGPKRQALAGTAEVYVTSYDTARIDAAEMSTSGTKAPLLALGPAALVVDECHLIKNQSAHRSRAVRRIAKRVDEADGAVIALSGTPITHHPGDLWPTLNCLEPGAYPSRERWVARYCQVLAGDYRDEILGLLGSREPEFRLSLLGQDRRVAKADVLAQLPPKVYSVRTVDLPAKWRTAYDDMESQMLAELPDGSEISVMGVLAKLTRLTQLASAAADVLETGEFDDFGTPRTEIKLRAPSWKVDALLELLEERQVNGSEPPRCEPVVCFAPSRQLVVLAGEAAAKVGYRVGYVIGGQSAKERTETVASFQAGGLDLICVTTGAGGVGITLTAARTVVFLQRPWSLVEALQAEDRCHRIGSEIHDSIEIVDIVARNTIDTRVRTVLRERAGQLAELVQDPRIVSELLGGKETASSVRSQAHHPAAALADGIEKGLN